MKFFKHILSLLFFLGLLSSPTQGEVISLYQGEYNRTVQENKTVFTIAEKEWLGLLHHKETLEQHHSFTYLISSESLSHSFPGKFLIFLFQKSCNISEAGQKLSLSIEGFKESDQSEGWFFQENPELVEAWKKMDDLGADDALRRNPGALEALDFKAKGDLDKIPDPSEYLDANYISNHLAKFDEGIGRVSTRANFEKFGTLGGDNSFVLPEGELRKILNETGGNIREIEKRLGMHEGDLEDNPVFGIFERESVGDLKMPSGKEVGADAELWIPGGKTSGGTSEAVVDLSGNTSFVLIN